MAYTPKIGEGTLYRNKYKKEGDKAPYYKGYAITPDGDLIGLAMWKVELDGGTILSLKVDDREGEYWAKKLDRKQVRMGGDDDRDSRNDSRGRDDRQTSRHGEDRSRSRHGADEFGGGRSRHAPEREARSARQQQRREPDPDFDDEIPF